MISIDSLHIGLNRFLLLTVGLWPYQQSKLVQFQLILFFSVLVTFILFQFTTFLTSPCTTDLFINVLSSVLCFVTFVIKYSFFSINIEVVKCLLEQLQHNCDELIDENEINIMKQYAINAKRYTAVLILLSASALFLYPIWPWIFDILLPKTRPHFLPLFVTEYFVDQERYFYLITLHANAAFAIGLIAMVATGSLFIVCLQHACGMFRIACYRIEQTMTIKTLQENSSKNKNLIYKGLIYAVDMHRKAMKLVVIVQQFSDSTISKFKVMFFFLIVVGVICGGLNSFRMVAFECNAMELLLPIIFVSIHFTYTFVGNYAAQQITDHNSDIFATVYNIQWYTAPLQIQKIILFLLQRSNKAFTLKYIGGLFVGSLEGAATLLKIAVSCFTVLHSIQK